MERTKIRTTPETLPSLLLALVAVIVILAAGALVVVGYTGGIVVRSLFLAVPMLVVAVAVGAVAVRSYRRANARLALTVFSGLGVALLVGIAQQIPGYVVVLEWNFPIPTLFAVAVMAAMWGGLYRSGID